MEYTVYILQSSQVNRFYIGYTNDLARRLYQHNFGRNGWTKTYRPWGVVHTESYNNRKEAITREKYLKSLKNKKLLRGKIKSYKPPILFN